MERRIRLNEIEKSKEMIREAYKLRYLRYYLNSDDYKNIITDVIKLQADRIRALLKSLNA